MRKLFLLSLTAMLCANFVCDAQKRTYLRNDSTAGNRNLVYIDTDPYSRNYVQLSSIIRDELESISYEAGLAQFPAGNPKPIMHFHRAGLPEDWSPVYCYQNTFYLYRPCDWGTHHKLIISDSTFAKKWMDGYEVNALTSCASKDGKVWNLIITGPDSVAEKLTITFINLEKRLALFDNHSSNEAERYQYMVAREGFKWFPLIANDCPETKASEWSFEVPVIKEMNKKYKK